MGQGTSQSLGQALNSGFHLPLDTSFTREGRAWRCPEDMFQIPSVVTNPFTTSFQPKLGLSHFVSRDILPCKSSPSSPDPWGIHKYTCFRLEITTLAHEGISQQQAGGAGDVEQGHTSVAASHCPVQHSLMDPRSLHRSGRF